MFSFNKNSISLKRHMLRRYRDADGDGDGVHVDSSSSSSRRSISCRAVGLRRMQLGKGSSSVSLCARPLPLASGRCAGNVFQFIMTTLADWRVGISAVYRLVCVRVCVCGAVCCIRNGALEAMALLTLLLLLLFPCHFCLSLLLPAVLHQLSQLWIRVARGRQRSKDHEAHR